MTPRCTPPRSTPLDARAGKLMGRVNVEGTKVVLSAAARLELDPVLYVSSLGVLTHRTARFWTRQSPVKDPPGPYYGSKVGAELIARGYQLAWVSVLVYVVSRRGVRDRRTLTSARAPFPSPAS